ncbi:TetR/AcrR family transcriptional regulator [Endozoicomonas arenosclerae]|uniref:TetR/AcrR family transcriptional regulator n=1 Tax=Endozoicomonas arenosclerae TaxID=1633495 RepID=UPI000784F8E9|nr:TetR/AcrR family transcriptional regulator [Endozoicomonas arenosclerae]
MRKDTIATRSLLINTAEKLFAEKGVESTTLFDVFKASGLKNRSALQYHFKDKAGLINAVLNKHSETVAQLRTKMLNELDHQDSYQLYDVIKAIVVPMAAQLENPDGGEEFIQLHSQLMVSKQYRELRTQRPEYMEEKIRIMTLIRPLLPTDKPVEKMIACSPLFDSLLIHGLARYKEVSAQVSHDIYLHTIIQAISDLLMQPHQAD